MHATLRIRDGYRILQTYNNRIMELSSLDDGVAFDSPVVRAAVEDGALVFAVGLRPTKPGKHPINGIFRVGYMHGTGEGTSEMSMVVILARFEPAALAEETRARAAGGFVAYSCVCTHQACPVNQWSKEQNALVCSCHGSVFDPRDGGARSRGPGAGWASVPVTLAISRTDT